MSEEDKKPMGDAEVLEETLTGPKKKAFNQIKELCEEVQNISIDKTAARRTLEDLDENQRLIGNRLIDKLDKFGLRGVKFPGVGSVSIQRYGGRESVSPKKLREALVMAGIPPTQQRKILDHAISQSEESYGVRFYKAKNSD